MELSPKERLTLALQNRTVDRPPCICPGGMMNMIVEDIMDLTGRTWPAAHSDPVLMAELAAGVYENGGFENFGVPFCMTVEAEAMGAQVCMGTRINEPHVTAYPLQSVDEWESLKAIDVNEGRAKVVIDAIAMLKSRNPDVPVIANVCGPVSLASSLVEPMVYYKELYKKNQKAHEMMAFVTDNLIAFGKAQIHAGADVLAISDPSGTGEILGLKGFNAFAVPYLNKIITAIKAEAEVGTIIHICGRLKNIYSGIMALSSDAISFDSITNVKKLTENVNNKVIMGNISTFLLEKGNSEKLALVAGKCVEDGVSILSPACGIGPKTRLTNIRSVVDVAKSMKANHR
jgi:[methyl-Co(III) methanol-specific corrinoid protein]:coenzyme M methyltransferase